MKPRLAITMGDPAGVGPEIILKALSRPSIRRLCEPIVFGDLAWLTHVQKRVLKGTPGGRLKLSVGDDKSSVRVVDFANVPKNAVRFGRASEFGGRASGDYIESAVDAVRRRFADALVTAPINKVSFRMGGWGKKHIGHTEMLAALTGAGDVGLMLVHGPLRVIHVTSHVALRDVPALITRRRVVASIHLAEQGARAMGIRRPRIAVCALNPHAGDGGLMGNEERSVIEPAIEEAKRARLRVDGPFPADTVWPFLLAKRFDVAVAMYHDQGQIPIKMRAFTVGAKSADTGGVNVTVGLPIIRTSVAHGTAYEIAGTGKASEQSLVDAMEMAAAMCAR